MINTPKMYTKYILIIAFIGIAYLSFLVIKPFIVVILTSAVLAYIFYPLYTKLVKKTGMKRVSSLLITLLILLIIVFPLAFVLNSVTREAYSVYNGIKGRISEGNLLGIECHDDSLLCKTSKFFVSNEKVSSYINEVLGKGTSHLITSTSNFIISLPGRILEFFMLIFVLYYFFIDGKTFTRKMWLLAPFKKSHRQDLVEKVNEITYAVIYGYLLTALLQGVLAGIGYFIFGFKSPILWGIITVFASLLPIIGSGIVWIPASLYLLLTGVLGSTAGLVWKGIGLFLYGFFIVSSIDNIIRPKLISRKAEVNPAVVLVGVLGGLVMFGFIGLIIGPLILTLFITFITLYEQEKR